MEKNNNCSQSKHNISQKQLPAGEDIYFQVYLYLSIYHAIAISNVDYLTCAAQTEEQYNHSQRSSYSST